MSRKCDIVQLINDIWPLILLVWRMYHFMKELWMAFSLILKMTKHFSVHGRWIIVGEQKRILHLSSSGGERALCARDAIKGRGYASRTSPNQEAESFIGLARGRNRIGRIRDRRAKPAGIWAQASKRNRGDQEVTPNMNARSLLAPGLKAI
jgi:hypothetical protein